MANRANRRWKDSFQFLRSRKNLEKDEMDSSIDNILKLAKSMNHDSYETVLKKKSELIQLVEEFHKQYHLLHFFYKDSQEKGKQDVSDEDTASSTSYYDSEESEMYYTPKTTVMNSTGRSSFDRDYFAYKSGSPCAEDVREVVKEAFYVEPVSISSKVEKADVDGLISELKLLREELDEKEDQVHYLTKAHHALEVEKSEKIKALDWQLDALESQLQILSIQNQGLKETNMIKDNEAKRICGENLILKDRIAELELIMEEKGDEIFAVLKNFNDNENLLIDSLSFQEGKIELLLSQTGKRSDEILVLQQELEKKSHEMSEFLKLADSLKEELERKTADEQNMAEEMNSLRIQIQELEMLMNSLGESRGINNEVEQLMLQNEKLYDRIILLEGVLKEKEDELATLQNKIEINHNKDNDQTEKEAEKQLEEKELNRMHMVHRQTKGIADTNLSEDVNVFDREEELTELMQKNKKLEIKVGELVKIVIENAEDMHLLKEQKREAIRQLCVWQDYHISRYDLLKKAFSDMIARNQVMASWNGFL
ncbi:hypothetical protein DCAR_0104452 [Daucus carota subsp. sativus]|uniref:NAB domain-containing protein n=2 Tax=Daucus carota subsp. sativus TaxID=79200 RepID=A0AAF0W8Q7_DAUCS|nr:hypothetical protein DCAR_0104452 [Daucus carota subsp. sativus]